MKKMEIILLVNFGSYIFHFFSFYNPKVEQFETILLNFLNLTFQSDYIYKWNCIK